ncbi:MAG: glycerophosphodiester phosphodiesterase [Ignavibacteriae bacterium]|nr:glycerophosphodiester phosphodiesterase [Ignavibacteriota bacterium]
MIRNHLLIGCLFFIIPKFWYVLENRDRALSLSSTRPVVNIIAHRGASAHAPENTLASFKKAVELGADILELDVHQTRDSQLVVIHDNDVDRTTNGNGKIKDLTYAQLQQLDAGSWFSSQFKGEKIPLLKEVIELSPDSLTLLVELKEGSGYYPNIEERLVNLLRQQNVTHRVILKSFEDAILNRFRELAPEIPRLKIVVAELSFFNLVIERGIQSGTILDDSVHYLQVHWLGATKHFIDKAHRLGYKVFAWDVNDADRMKELINKGIDGIETDYPDVLKTVLLEYK